MPRGALGRNVEHDPRSRAYPALRSSTLVTVAHRRHVPIFDQGELGSCTGNAMAGLLASAPFVHRDSIGHTADEALAVALYEKATILDDTPGEYPPDDTGSSGLAVAKAAWSSGYIKAYGHAFGLDHALAALVVAPVMTGVNWYDSFDDPSSSGRVTITRDAEVVGGHEFLVRGINVEHETVIADNSWGPEWGLDGRFHFSWSTWERLLAEDGDVTTITSL